MGFLFFVFVFVLLLLLYACSDSYWRRDMVVRFVDISGIIDHHCLNFIYITLLMDKDYYLSKYPNTSINMSKNVCTNADSSIRWRAKYLYATWVLVVWPPQRHFCVSKYFTEYGDMVINASSNYTIYFKSSLKFRRKRCIEHT